MRLKINENFRESMGWLHTWLGISLAAVLFAVFWTGTLTVFDREIDQWMKPELRLAPPANVSLDETALVRLAELDIEPASTVWVGTPRDRIPVVRLYYDDVNGASHEEWLNPETGDVLELTDSHAGSEFLFHFHFMLHMPGIIGYYLVGLAAMGMMALIVSGIFIHRKIIQEFFTFRPRKKARRTTLDLHNLTAVIALPFHFIIPLSGLLILASTYFPWSMTLPYDGDFEQLDAELLAYEHRLIDPAGEPAQAITSLDEYITRANHIWRAQEGEKTSEPDWLAVFNFNDAESYVVVERFWADKRVAIGPDQIVFNPRNGEVIDQFRPLPIHGVSNWLEGLHWIQFDHWLLRWLYFFAGLSGCVMIGSGMIFWLQSRIKKYKPDPLSVRFVRALSVASITGLITGTCGFFVANRLIPKTVSLQGIHRHDLEIWVFFVLWILAFLHAIARDKSAWRDQSLGVAVLATVAVILNWITTGDHPIAAINASIWSVAVMDIVILAGAAIALSVFLRLNKPELPGLKSSTQTSTATTIRGSSE